MSLSLSLWEYLIVLCSPLLWWHEMIKILCDEMKWGKWQHCDILLGYYWTSEDKSGGSSVGWWWETEQRERNLHKRRLLYYSRNHWYCLILCCKTALYPWGIEAGLYAWSVKAGLSRHLDLEAGSLSTLSFQHISRNIPKRETAYPNFQPCMPHFSDPKEM